MRIKFIKIQFIFIILTIITSCNDTLFNSGDIISKDYNIDEFNEIYVNDIFDIYLIQDSVCKINAKGGNNLLPYIDFKVTEGKLYITNNNTAQWSRNYERIKLYISVKEINFLRLDESSNVITLDTLITPKLTVYSINDYSDISIIVKCTNFHIVNEGTSGGYFTIKGETINSNIWNRGSCIIYAIDFSSKKAIVKNESIGDCYINVLNILETEILRSGKIYYKGNPETISYINDHTKSQVINIE